MKLLGTGSYVPPIILKNEELEERVDTTAKWIEENLGIMERRIAGPNQNTADLATYAGYEAIENSGVSVRNIDLLIVATATPDRKAPSTACSIQARLGVCNAVAFDVNAVCSGFLYGMSIADAYLCMGLYDYALIIGVDVFSRITDWNQRDCVFFGDGAGAAVFGGEYFGSGDRFTSKLYSDGSGSEGFTAGDFFKMDKRAVYDAAVTHLPKAIERVLHETGLTIDDIDMMIPHQPSIRVLKETAKRIGLPWDKVKTNMDRYANTAAATIPILLDEVRPPKGSKVLFAAMGSGWTYGAAILEI
jgi:3-oxoacyl-[acyl-carrier-protein] synthase-3